MTAPEPRTMTIVCRRCGQHTTFEIPTMGSPRQTVLGRWWRRRTLRVLLRRDEWRLGRAVQNATVYHYIARCPDGFAAEAEGD